MKIGLALGSGAARGWSHIGVIRSLAEQGIEPDIVCGTSIGALVGASYCSGKLNDLEQWVCSLSRLETAKFFDINSRFNGFVNRDKLHEFLCHYVASEDRLIEHLAKQYCAVSTELETGREVWLSSGSVLEGVWSSIALPGLFPAIRYRDQWLVDGGLVNPVPVSACRALGADIVIAVNLNGALVGKHIKRSESDKRQKPVSTSSSNSAVERLADRVVDYTTSLFASPREASASPGLLDAIAGSINIIQDRITRSRMAGDPPDVMFNPIITDINLLEFYRASEAIEEGRNCVKRMMPELKRVLAALG